MEDRFLAHDGGLPELLERLRSAPSSLNAPPLEDVKLLRQALVKVGLASESGTAYSRTELEHLLRQSLLTPKVLQDNADLLSRQV